MKGEGEGTVSEDVSRGRWDSRGTNGYGEDNLTTTLTSFTTAALLGQPVHSRSTLLLVEKATPLAPPPPQPASLLTDTLDISGVNHVFKSNWHTHWPSVYIMNVD